MTSVFIAAFDEIQKEVHDVAVSKGWYHDSDGARIKRNLGEVIALMHSELSEALESLRSAKDKMSDKIPDFLGIEEEFADVVIRIMDTAHEEGYRIGEAILKKIEYNKTRPFKHGKTF